MTKTRKVSKRRYSRRKTTQKHSKKVYRNKNKRKKRRSNRTKRRMRGGSGSDQPVQLKPDPPDSLTEYSEEEPDEPDFITCTINSDGQPPVRRLITTVGFESDGTEVGMQDENVIKRLSRGEKVSVFNPLDIKYNDWNSGQGSAYEHVRVKLNDNQEGYIRRDFLEGLPPPTP